MFPRAASSRRPSSVRCCYRLARHTVIAVTVHLHNISIWDAVKNKKSGTIVAQPVEHLLVQPSCVRGPPRFSASPATPDPRVTLNLLGCAASNWQIHRAEVWLLPTLVSLALHRGLGTTRPPNCRRVECSNPCSNAKQKHDVSLRDSGSPKRFLISCEASRGEQRRGFRNKSLP